MAQPTSISITDGWGGAGGGSGGAGDSSGGSGRDSGGSSNGVQTDERLADYSDRVQKRLVRWCLGLAVLLFAAALGPVPGVKPITAAVIGAMLLAAAAVLRNASVVDAWIPRLAEYGRIGSVLAALGILGMITTLTAPYLLPSAVMFWLGIGLTAVGGTWMIAARWAGKRPGVHNDGVKTAPLTSRAEIGWMLGILMTGFYVVLYWFPQALDGLIRSTEPFSQFMRGQPADQWFLYGLFYTLAVVIMGVRALYKFRHDRYHVIRTCSVIFFQLCLAFILPYVLVLFNEPEFYFSYFWPLKWTYLWPGDYGFGWLLEHPGRLGAFMVGWGIIMSFVATPILTYFYGKRWYCSWVCGCGGLAETMGDPYRHLAPRSLRSWQLERWMVHGSLLFIVLATILVWVNAAVGGWIFGSLTGAVARIYGFLIGSVFAGVIGVGFYPVLGSRIWCRYGCPMAAILGIQQKYFSRFRITTNGGQCISCGNCSAYCEMGIDVRWYAQRGQNIVRASCVGCGMCSTVCPRGVLKLENGPRDTQYGVPVLVDRDEVDLISDDNW